MNNKLTRLLNRRIKLPFPMPKVPAPVARGVSRAITFLLLFVMCLFVLWRTILFFEVRHRFAKLREAGHPASGAELNDWLPSVPDEGNGAPTLIRAFDLMEKFNDDRARLVAQGELLSRTNAWSEETREMVADFVAMNSHALAEARIALENPQFRFPVDFSYGVNTEFPHVPHLRDMAHILALQSMIEATDGQSNNWARSAMTICRLAATLDEESAIISFLVRNAMIFNAVRVTQRNLAECVPDANHCRQLQEALAAAIKTNLLANALIGERAMLAPSFRLSAAEVDVLEGASSGSVSEERQRPSGKPSPWIWLSGILERDLSFYLKTMEAAVSQAQLPFPERLEMTNHFERAEQVANRRTYFLSGMILPAYSTFTVREARTQARVHMAITALAIERHRMAHDQLPESVEELVPAFLDFGLMDPFTGKPLRYRTTYAGYVLYSVGADGRDDGGVEPPPRRKISDTNSYDLTFIVER